MIQDNFIDGVGNIHVTGNMVRFDFITLNPNQKNEQGQPIYNVTQRVVIPLEGFLQAFVLQDNLIKQLIEAGIVQHNAKPVVPQVEGDSEVAN